MTTIRNLKTTEAQRRATLTWMAYFISGREDLRRAAERSVRYQSEQRRRSIRKHARDRARLHHAAVALLHYLRGDMDLDDLNDHARFAEKTFEQPKRYALWSTLARSALALVRSDPSFDFGADRADMAERMTTLRDQVHELDLKSWRRLEDLFRGKSW